MQYTMQQSREWVGNFTAATAGQVTHRWVVWLHAAVSVRPGLPGLPAGEAPHGCRSGSGCATPTAGQGSNTATHTARWFSRR